MDQITPNLLLPYIMAAQAQKHVTHNEAIRMLDALVQVGVASRAQTTPPASPADGVRYIVAAAATGAWAGQTGSIAAFQDGAWDFYPPRPGFTAWVADEAIAVVYNGTAWIALLSLPSSVAQWGIGAAPDATNLLAVKSSASLFDNIGHGHQVKLNKATTADTASVLIQTGYSGRAELGLTGDDNLHLKVSADGTTWRDALILAGATGQATFAAGLSASVLQTQSYTVATLPSPSAALKAAKAFASNARKSGEAAGAGSGVPVWCDGVAWRTYYDNSVAAA